ncbi:hypothetical protein [Rhodoferax sp. BLA1]|uniref:hypothetical protein n=1 Tax=Rhodoferax sp. BLA1 TaxID=2576062 RepID=UPI0015D1FDEE|nr:hypothetical protein [Rhodoferax sp. BLA1]
MPAAHIYIFSDASPTDWLSVGSEGEWHTIANLVVQTDPQLFTNGFGEVTHEAALPADPKYLALIDCIKQNLPSGQLRKWSTGPGYKARFCRAVTLLPAGLQPVISGLSFQERALRQSEAAVLQAYNQLIGGVEGRGIGFSDYLDGRGRRCLRHSFINCFGHHEISGPDTQLLVLLLTAWRIADQYSFYYREIVQSGRFGFDDLLCTVVSDKLSGDDDVRTKAETTLRNLVDPDRETTPIRITRSTKSDDFSGDLLVDNIAGWLNTAIREPSGDIAATTRGLTGKKQLAGWHYLVPSGKDLRLASAHEAVGGAAT